jgi:hypothetical protein
MEGEKQFPIPLDSPLDINSNDMLVPASKPLFSFNRQRYLGSVLQNSVRYEADGWFAGWWVHNFDFVSIGTITIEPTTIGFPSLQDKLIPGQQSQKYWNVKFNEIKLEFNFNPALYVKNIEGTSSVSRTSDGVIHVAGTTTGGKTYSVDVDAYTGTVIAGTFTSDDPSLVPSGYLSGNIFNLTVERPFTLGTNYIHIRYGYNLNFEGATYPYAFDGAKHTWGNLFEITGDTVTLADTTAYTFVDAVPEYIGQVTERFKVRVKSKGVFTIKEEIAYRLVGGYDAFYDFTRYMPDYSHLVDNAAIDAANLTAPDVVNTEELEIVRFGSASGATAPFWDAFAEIGWYFPIWIKLGQVFDSAFTIYIYDRHVLPPTTDPDTGDLIINSWYDAQITLALSRAGKNSTIQNVIDDMGVEWVIEIEGIEYTDDNVPDDPTAPMVIPITNIMDSRNLPKSIDIKLSAVNKNPDLEYPVPPNYVYASITFTIEFDIPTWTEIPPPPPKWVTETRGVESWTLYLNPVGVPTTWANPVPYAAWPAYWPSRPINWANPVVYNAAGWPAQPTGWTNPVAIGTLTWPAMPADWDDVAMPWATYIAGKRFGLVSDVPDWSTYTAVPYATFAGAAPANWPFMVAWPSPTVAAWTPPWPPNWPYGIPGLPANEWFLPSQAYGPWLTALKPANWPVTMNWPVTPEGGWAPRSGPSYPYTVNTTQPDAWIPPWPPQWYYGMTGLPTDEWFITAQTYEQYVTANPIPNWPIPWAWTRSHGANNTWPFTTIDGSWVMRTGSNPYNFTVNPAAPTDWMPDWPIWWPYDIANAPPGWYGTPSHIEYVSSHDPYKAPAADWSTGGDPGFAWPGRYFTEPQSAFPSSPVWPYPLQLPADYVIYTGDPTTAGAIIFNDTVPGNWPRYVEMPLAVKGEASDLFIGPDVTDGYRYEILNRPSLFMEDEHLFGVVPAVDDGEEFSEEVVLKAIFPFCIKAWTYNRVDTVDITLCLDQMADPMAFTIRRLSNLELGIRVFRLDDNALQPGYEKYSLNTIEAYINSVNQPSGSGINLPVQALPALFEIMIMYRNTKNVRFDKVITYVWPRDLAESVNAITNLQQQMPKEVKLEAGFYPLWIVESSGGHDFWHEYTNIGDIKANKLKLTIVYFEWLTGRNGGANITVTPDSPTNDRFITELYSGSIETPNTAGRDFPWAPGIFEQIINYIIDPANSISVEIDYDVRVQTQDFAWSKSPPDPWGFEADPVTLTHTQLPRPIHEITINLNRGDELTLYLMRAFVIDRAGLMQPADIISATQLLVNLTAGYGNVDNTGKYSGNTLVQLIKIDKTETAVTINVSAPNRAKLTYLPLGIFWRNKEVKYISYNANTLVFEYDGTTYTLFIGNDVDVRLVYSAVDIRDGIRRDLWSEKTTELKMAIKQFWSNDVSIENFWWIDSEHVLVLSKYEMSLYRKMVDEQGEYLLDDWNGNRWEVVKFAPRGHFFTSNDLYYSVSAAYNREPVLFKMQNAGTSIKLFVIRGSIKNLDFSHISWDEVDIPVVEYKLNPGGGSKQLAMTNELSAFVPVDINSLLCSAKISSTAVGSSLLIGFAVTRGILQWTLQFDISGTLGQSFKVINGYGHVGHNGTLTGGQYPSLFCDGRGFFGDVYHVADFKDSDETTNPVYAPDEKIFCSGTSIWFVYKQLVGLVSHLLFNGGSFIPEIIPLECNYSVAWGLSGHKTIALFDTFPRSMGLADLLSMGEEGNSALATALSYFSAIAMPSLWYMQPIVAAAVFAAESMHQAAYVIRNSLPAKSDDGKSDKDVSVLRTMKELGVALDIGKLKTFTSLIVGLVGSVVSAASSDSLKIDESKGAQSPDDTKGRKLGQFASQAILNGISVALSSKGLVFAVKTKAEEIMALSMFYGINDGAECWAGPGFVNHNFIGQCVAQGVSIIRLKLDKFGAYLPLQFVTELLFKIQYLVMEALDAAVDKAFGGTGNAQGAGYGLGTGTSIPVGMIAGIIANSAKFATDKLLAMYRFIHDKVIPALYQALGEEGRGFYSGGIDKNNIELEATHTYGNKPMSLFYPAFISNPADHINSLTVEAVDSAIRWEAAENELSGFLNSLKLSSWDHPDNTVNYNNRYFDGGASSQFAGFPFEGSIYMPKDVTVASCKSGDGTTNPLIDTRLPVRMAAVEGIVNMLPVDGDLKNLQVNCCDYTFPAPPIHDYILTQSFGEIGVQAANGEIIAYSMDDTKLMDGPASNIVETGTFFGIASSYIAIEVKDEYDHDYLRPWAITPTCIALNINKINTVQMAKAYHGFDGQFNRITSWKGGNGLDSATMVQQYCFQVNDHFKRSNIIPPSEFFGMFQGPPQIAMRAIGTDRIANQIMDLTRQKGMDINIPGEDRDLTRYAVPVHSEMLSTLPATVRMLAPYKLHVVEGITSLTTDVRSTQTKYKAPSSVDFNLYDTMYRATEEYIALLELKDGVVAVTDKVPSAGLTFIGATTKEAFFYSPATRMYYSFSGGGDITKNDIFNRFKDIKGGRWDFVNQEVIFKMLLDNRILNEDVDGNFIARLDKGNVLGELYAPNATIYNERSDFKILSMAGGLVYQGPKRCVVNRWVLTDDMYDQIKVNKKKWKKLDRELWAPGRDYHWAYEDWHTDATLDAVYGWTHNPWRAATAMLGVSEETDCLFEWELTFAWTEQVNNVFEQNEFISFNLAGETIGAGGTLLSRPTHLFLYKELFKNGYYTTRYSSKNGIGNRERLYMWGDGMAALESLSLYAKDITTRRAQPLVTSQVDVQNLIEQ